jgi:hypothetical protein
MYVRLGSLDPISVWPKKTGRIPTRRKIAISPPSLNIWIFFIARSALWLS